jgi:Homeodomain-like domain
VTEQELTRRAKRRLAILCHAEEFTGNLALTCRYDGIGRQVVSKWRQRCDEHGLDGLRDRAHRPLVCPNQTRTEVVGKLIYLRQSYHFGPAKIAMYPRRYHDLQSGHSGVWRVLKRLDLNRLPASQRHKRTTGAGGAMSRPLPGHRVQLDVKFIAPWLAHAASTTSSPPSTTAPACGSCASTPAQPADGHPVRRLRAGAAPVPGRGYPERPSILVVPVVLGSFGRTWPCSGGSAPVRCRCVTDRSQGTPCLLITERAGHRRGGGVLLGTR